MGITFLFSCTKTETQTATITPEASKPTTPTAPDTVLVGKINQTPVFQFQGFNYGLWGKVFTKNRLKEVKNRGKTGVSGVEGVENKKSLHSTSKQALNEI